MVAASDLSSETRLRLDDLMDRGLGIARLVVIGMKREGMGPEMEAMASEAAKALRELELSIQVRMMMMMMMMIMMVMMMVITMMRRHCCDGDGS